MKKIESFGISMIICLVIGFAAILRILTSSYNAAAEFTKLPAGFPSRTGFIVIWGFLFILWGIGSCLVYSIKLTPRRKRNILLNCIVMIIGIFLWHFMVFGAVNFSGALAIAIALILLGVVVWFMFLVVQRYGGYLFTPMIIWLLYQLYLSIALLSGN